MGVRAVVGLVLLVVSPLLAACQEETQGTTAGEVVKAREDDQFTDGRESFVVLPTGRLLIHAADPVDGATADETRAHEAVDAPAGGVLVPITWQYDTWASDRLDGIFDTNKTPLVSLVADGERYRLPPPQREQEAGDSFYVVVDGDAEDRTLEIEFDGVTQTVDLATGSREPGEADALYDIEDTKLKKKRCDDAEWFDSITVNAEFTCNLVGPVLTPYAAGKWAPEGSVWLALTLTTEMGIYAETNLFGSGVRYSAESVEVKPEIDGEEPAELLPTETDADRCPLLPTNSCGWSKHVVFVVPADDGEQGPLDLQVKYELNLVNSWGNWDPPRRVKAKAEETIKLWED